VINNSRTYDGTFNLTYFRKTSAYANLADDLQNKTLDLSTGSDTVITNAVFLTKLKALSGNGNLNINAVVITKTSGGAI
jgi:wobble nucleotide-excising tRNase